MTACNAVLSMNHQISVFILCLHILQLEKAWFGREFFLKPKQKNHAPYPW